ncbi:hypothetical protein AXF42_Ash001602 [Apostasia shenzhenica]|uniref:C2H2-type domain-containing protein n=1 Tax=Apostasia shenzhenica TaxID=1088818 RepID=A0A2I0AAQ3_9ASPA|nr:hypothetical protein AXF42_Ash001602 [Apostasia shenzhenica]
MDSADVLLKQRTRREEKVAEQRMPAILWVSLKRSLRYCTSEQSEVHEPRARGSLDSILTWKPFRSGCSRSISNLRDVVIHGSKRHLEMPPSCSPMSIGSSELLNPIAHGVILSNSKCELRIASFSGYRGGEAGMSSTFVSAPRPGTPCPGLFEGPPHNSFLRRSSSALCCEGEKQRSRGSNLSFSVLGINEGEDASLDIPRASLESAIASAACHKCGEHFRKMEALEAHRLSKHSVTELVEGDSSRKIVEIICRTSTVKSSQGFSVLRIERILKVHNMQETLARFEDYRDTVKLKASMIQKKHPRCLADGNELLRFHGTTMACNLGVNGSNGLCVSENCSVCRVIRHGFSIDKDLKEGTGVFTASTGRTAFESIVIDGCVPSMKKALLVCRAIAGRVHKPLENLQELACLSGFDSLAGKFDLYSNMEELYLLNPLALLPCFVVVCNP